MFKLRGPVGLACMQQPFSWKGRTSVDNMQKLLPILNIILPVRFQGFFKLCQLVGSVMLLNSSYGIFRCKQIAEDDISKLLFADSLS
jgi:hypothetical protein